MLVLGTPEHVELGFKLQTQPIPIAVYFNFCSFYNVKQQTNNPKTIFAAFQKILMLGILGTPIKSCQKLSQNQRSFLILPGYRKLCFHTSPQVKEKIPETWERLSYLMDHNEERSADPGLWGTYR